MGKPFDSEKAIPTGMVPEVDVECFPLASLLKALNRTRVDLMSLDVENQEYGILREFPFHEIDVHAMIIEDGDVQNRPGGQDGMANLLRPKGYELVGRVFPDAYFVKKKK